MGWSAGDVGRAASIASRAALDPRRHLDAAILADAPNTIHRLDFADGPAAMSAPPGVRAPTAPGPEAIASLRPDAACALLDGPALPDDDARCNLAAALTSVQSCAEASRMPERVARLPGLLRRSGDAAPGKALRDGSRRMSEARFGRRTAAAMDGGADDAGARDGRVYVRGAGAMGSMT